MEAKLLEYRRKKRREAIINNFKETLWNMVSFQQVRNDGKSDHVIVEDLEKPVPGSSTVSGEPKKKPILIGPPQKEPLSDIDSISSSDYDIEQEGGAPAKPSKTRTLTDYFLYVIYFLLWATCYAIAIELKFGMVFLLFSALFGVYFNTRTGPKDRREVSAYSVFNKDCQAINGSLDANQFDREIRGGPSAVR